MKESTPAEQSQTEIEALREQIKIMNSRTAVDAKSYERDQYLIAALRKQLASSATANAELREALEVLLTNSELGEYESQKRGLPRMIEARDKARDALAKSDELAKEAAL